MRDDAGTITGSVAAFVDITERKAMEGRLREETRILEMISQAGSASLDVVAGPIGEALIATAIGIATALPAVLAYNFFLRRMRLSVSDLENFAHDFLRLAAKHDYKV